MTDFWKAEYIDKTVKEDSGFHKRIWHGTTNTVHNENKRMEKKLEVVVLGSYYNHSVRHWAYRKHLCADHSPQEKHHKDNPRNICHVSGSGGFGVAVF